MKTTHHLQYVESRRSGSNVVYGKFQIVIPSELITQVGCQAGDEVTYFIDRNNRMITTFSTPKPRRQKLNLEKFRETLFWILTQNPSGLPYGEIQRRAPVLPKKPPAVWVQELERGEWLERSFDSSHRRIWKVKMRPSLGATNSETIANHSTDSRDTLLVVNDTD